MSNLNVLVDIEGQGKIKGIVEEDYLGGKYCSFLGIPYAAPPVGELRFKSPRPPVPWNGIRDANSNGNPSLGRHMMTNEFIGDEDCLFLNVFTPQVPSANNTQLKPVLFFIHGGGFESGSNHTELYGAGYLITADIVLVAINYRLGALGAIGFKNPKLDAPGNNGMKDCVAALKWVQKHIHRFGGDPKNVTIFGESAGGAACQYLMLSPMSKNLFQRAIMQSGSVLNIWAYSRQQPDLLATLLGYKGPTDDEEQIYKFLLNVPAKELLMNQQKISSMPGFMGGVLPWSPCIEVTGCPTEPNFLTKSPIEIIKSGDFYQVPTIFGFNSMEGLIFMANHIQANLKNMINFKSNEDLIPLPMRMRLKQGSEVSIQLGNTIKEFYYGTSKPSQENYKPFIDYVSDVNFVYSIIKSVELFAKYSSKPVYLYRFDVDLPYSLIKHFFGIPQSGCTHAEELAYLFHNPVCKLDKTDTPACNTIHRLVHLWTNFAKTNNPNCLDGSDPLLPTDWKPIEKDAKSIKLLNIKLDLNVDDIPEAYRLQFWDTLLQKIGLEYI